MNKRTVENIFSPPLFYVAGWVYFTFIRFSKRDYIHKFANTFKNTVWNAEDKYCEPILYCILYKVTDIFFLSRVPGVQVTRLSTLIFSWFKPIWAPDKQAQIFSNSVAISTRKFGSIISWHTLFNKLCGN